MLNTIMFSQNSLHAHQFNCRRWHSYYIGHNYYIGYFNVLFWIFLTALLHALKPDYMRKFYGPIYLFLPFKYHYLCYVNLWSSICVNVNY